MEPSQPALSPESLLSSAGFVRNLARGLLRDPHSADYVALDAARRYLLLSASGAPVVADLTRPSATGVLGTTPLTVHATPGTRIYLVPAGACELVELMAGRVASRTVDATGVLD